MAFECTNNTEIKLSTANNVEPGHNCTYCMMGIVLFINFEFVTWWAILIALVGAGCLEDNYFSCYEKYAGYFLSIVIPKISFILGILMQRISSIVINKGLKAIEHRFENVLPSIINYNHVQM